MDIGAGEPTGKRKLRVLFEATYSVLDQALNNLLTRLRSLIPPCNSSSFIHPAEEPGTITS
nr:hypothetical protein Q903MT_gene4911 [Picea sitchensis]